MKPFLLLLSLIFCAGLLFADTIIVSSDGSGDALTIQAGINLAVTSDTVIVAQGIWTGSINIENKAITLGSYYIIDGDTTHISQTIIDGEDTRTGIIATNCSGSIDTLQIVGFTIRNCRSNWFPEVELYSNGGGIGIQNSIAIVNKCTIYQCRAYMGGGISVLSSVVFLKGNQIYRNAAIEAGGGISGHETGTLINFDSQELNSIYLNNSPMGCDIVYAASCIQTTVFLDKGSVAIADQYFYFCINPMPVFVNQAAIQQVNHDLWVSPWGSDANDGLSAQTPLQTISYALAKAQPESGVPITVQLLSGVYSWSQNRNPLPLQPKSYVNLNGAENGAVILDGEGYCTFVRARWAQDYIVMSDIRFVNGHSTYSSLIEFIDEINGHTDKITLKNISLSNSWVMNDAVRIMSCHDVTVDNLVIQDSRVFNGLDIFCYESVTVTNSKFQRLQATNYDMYNSSCSAVGINKPLSAAALQSSITVSNCLITDNTDTSEFWPNVPSGLSIGVEGGNCEVNVTNCTIANNTSVTQSGGLNFGLENCNATVTNTIVSGNEPFEVSLHAIAESAFGNVTFTNGLVTGGDNSFYTSQGNITHTWGQQNLFVLPGFVGTGRNPYFLSEDSPCIDAGTADTTGLNLPIADLAGNYRVWNNRIDMGCYEYGSEHVGTADDENPPAAEVGTLVAYPNPFKYFTTIRYKLDYGQARERSSRLDGNDGDEWIPRQAGNDSKRGNDGFLDISVYNIKGQKIKTVTSKSRVKTANSNAEQVTYWDGKDEAGKACSSGIYLLKLTLDGKAASSRKVTLVR